MTKHNHTPRPMPADFDVFNFNTADYMEASGLNSAINDAFDALEGEISAAFELLTAHMESLFAAWEAELSQ